MLRNRIPEIFLSEWHLALWVFGSCITIIAKKIVRVMNENNENKGTDNDHDKIDSIN